MRKQNGLSLIELMISLTLGIVLMTGVVQMFLTSRVTYTTQQAISRIQESGRMAVEFMSRDIRMAGYMGCSSRNRENIQYGLEASNDFQYNFDVGIQGYGAADSPLGAGVAKDNTDVLVVRRASEGQGRLLGSVSESSSNIDIAGAVVNGCVGTICTDSVAVISDCAQGRIFRVVNLSTPGSVDGVRLVHSGGGSDPRNLDTKLGGQVFAPGAEVLGIQTVTYYVAPSTVAGTFSLWKNVMGDSVELIEGVEDMRLRYGIDNSGGGVPNTYVEASGVTNWDEVSAVRIHLVMQSIERNVVPEPQPYFLVDETVDDSDIIGDRRMRQVFTSTIGIRSRLN